jgi:hypothetical protein
VKRLRKDGVTAAKRCTTRIKNRREEAQDRIVYSFPRTRVGCNSLDQVIRRHIARTFNFSCGLGMESSLRTLFCSTVPMKCLGWRYLKRYYAFNGPWLVMHGQYYCASPLDEPAVCGVEERQMFRSCSSWCSIVGVQLSTVHALAAFKYSCN